MKVNQGEKVSHAGSKASRIYPKLFAPIRTLIIFFIIRFWRAQPHLLPRRDRHPASSEAIRKCKCFVVIGANGFQLSAFRISAFPIVPGNPDQVNPKLFQATRTYPNLFGP
jgi:hypothetical protein